MFKCLLFFILVWSTFSYSQNHGDIKWIEGVKYTYHKVEKRETLYAISKKYGLKINEVLINNPEAIDGLQPEMLLKIPLSKKNEKEETELDLDGDYLIHVVQAQETLYSLSKQYETTPEDLTKLNNLEDGLKVGLRLKVKLKESFGNDMTNSDLKKLDSTKTVSYTKYHRDTVKSDSSEFSVALLLPFYLDENDEIELNKEEGEDDRLPSNSIIPIEFYGGVLLAMDSLTNLGYNVRLSTFDTKGNDTLNIDSLLKKEDFSKYDLIVGPMYSDNYKFFVKKMNSGEMAILSPFNKNDDFLKLNKRNLKAYPSIDAEIEAIGGFIGKEKSQANIILVYESTSKKDYQYIETLKENLMFSSLKYGDGLELAPTISVNYRATGLNGIAQNFSGTKENVVVFLSSNQTFISKVLQKLVPFSEDNSITVFGTNNWKDFKTFEPEYFSYLDIHLSCTGLVDYEKTEVVDFQKKYYGLFKTEPSRYSFQAFDQVFMIGSLAADNPYYRHYQIVGKDHKGLYSSYRYKYTGNNSGLENNKAFIIRFNDYKFRKVDE